jgi:hypothetical protein
VTRDAFISYAARDRATASMVCSRLSSLGLRLWFDVDELPRSRDSWRRAVHDGIADSRAVLVLLSEHWHVSPACRYELAITVERRVPVIAIRLAGRPDMSAVPSPLPTHVEFIEADGAFLDVITVVGERLARRTAGPRTAAGATPAAG